jgi:hypothetical protein
VRVDYGDRSATVEFSGAAELTIEDGEVSSEYGRRQPAPVLRAAVHAALPLTIAYRIAPV